MSSEVIRPSTENLIKDIDNCKDELIEESFFAKTPERKRRIVRENSGPVELNIFDQWQSKHKMVFELLPEKEKTRSKDEKVVLICLLILKLKC